MLCIYSKGMIMNLQEFMALNTLYSDSSILLKGFLHLVQGNVCIWASYQINKIAGYTYAGNGFPTTDFKGNR